MEEVDISGDQVHWFGLARGYWVRLSGTSHDVFLVRRLLGRHLVVCFARLGLGGVWEGLMALTTYSTFGNRHDVASVRRLLDGIFFLLR